MFRTVMSRNIRCRMESCRDNRCSVFGICARGLAWFCGMRHSQSGCLWLFCFYLFTFHEGSLDRKLRTLCRRIGIEEKSLHKIRKIYISTLIDQGVNLNTIREMVGHEDERVTLNSYCFDRRNTEQIEEQLEKALSFGQ